MLGRKIFGLMRMVNSSENQHDVQMNAGYFPLWIGRTNCTMNSVAMLYAELKAIATAPVITLVVISLIANCLGIATFVRMKKKGQIDLMKNTLWSLF